MERKRYGVKTVRDGQTGIEKRINGLKFNAHFYLRT